MASIGGNMSVRDYEKYYNHMLAQYLYGPGLSGVLGNPVPPPIERPTGTTLLAVGSYLLTSHDAGYRLWRDDGPTVNAIVVCEWVRPPSRDLVAAAVRWDRHQRPKTNARDPLDGSLLGVRYYTLTNDYHLASPIQKTVWESETLTAATWDEDEAVRGKCGIHAAWPCRDGRVRPPIDAQPASGMFVASVRGLLRYVIGKEGWRAERAIIDTVYLPPEILSRWRVVKRLEKLYPSVTFEEETWTLERSLKSARSSLKTCR